MSAVCTDSSGISYSDLTAGLLRSRFPELEARITDALRLELEEFPHGLFESVLGRFLSEYFGTLDLPKAKTSRQKKAAVKSAEPIVIRVFEFYEELARSADEEVRNLLQVSLLEPLYDNTASY